MGELIGMKAQTKQGEVQSIFFGELKAHLYEIFYYHFSQFHNFMWDFAWNHALNIMSKIP